MHGPARCEAAVSYHHCTLVPSHEKQKQRGGSEAAYLSIIHSKTTTIALCATTTRAVEGSESNCFEQWKAQKYTPEMEVSREGALSFIIVNQRTFEPPSNFRMRPSLDVYNENGHNFCLTPYIHSAICILPPPWGLYPVFRFTLFFSTIGAWRRIPHHSSPPNW